jgi:hypothetical protein
VIFACYYESSFLKRNMCPPGAWPTEAQRWTDTLWEIRNTKGQDYTNKLMFFAFSMWNTSVSKTENLDTFFFNKILAGETVIDSDLEAFAKLRDVAASHGISIDTH